MRITLLKTALTALLLFAGVMAYGQDSLQFYNQSCNNIKLSGMKVLGTWAAANIITGTVGYYNSGGATQRFHQMNIIWNVVNLGAATAGYLGTRHGNRALNAEESLREQRKLERTFLINAGLDVAYIGAGLYLRHRGTLKILIGCGVMALRYYCRGLFF